MNPIDLSTRILIGNTPDDDYCGLSPNQVHELYYDTFSANSSLQFHPGIDDAVLDQVPFFRLTEALIHIIRREQLLKLTKKGALTKKVLEELFSHKYIPEDLIASGISKLTREDDCVSIANASIVAQNSGLVKKVAGKLSLTKLGARLCAPVNRVELFYCIFLTFTQRINWAYNDLYTEDAVAQLGWAYSMYLLMKYGDQERNIDFYAERFLTAFPDFINSFPIDAHHTPKEMFLHCYGIRTLDRFFEWFGFVDNKQPRKFLDRSACTFTSSEILGKIFVFD